MDFDSAHSGLFGMSARADSNQLGQAREAMLAQVDLCRERLAKPDELTKAIKQFTAGNLAALRTMQGLAGDLGSNWLYTNDLHFSWKHLESVQNTTPEQLQKLPAVILPRQIVRSTPLLQKVHSRKGPSQPPVKPSAKPKKRYSPTVYVCSSGGTIPCPLCTFAQASKADYWLKQRRITE